MRGDEFHEDEVGDTFWVARGPRAEPQAWRSNVSGSVGAMAEKKAPRQRE